MRNLLVGLVIGFVLATAPNLTALTPAQEEAERIRRQDQDYQRGIEQRERQRQRQEERAKRPC